MVTELTGNGFEEFIKEGVVLVDFWAPWCMPCLMMGEIVDEIGEKFEGKAKVGKVNIDNNQEIARKFGVSSIPNFVFFKDGEVVEQFVGGMSLEDLSENLEKYV